ncbi:Cupredoxin [Xylariaceae sp. FL0662B]|nr:Cupredoxin [Xylariaceae sp. FL0662B]
MLDLSNEFPLKGPKYAVALSAAVAPLAIAKAVHNVYPLGRRNGHLKGMEAAAGGGAEIAAAAGLQGLAIGSTTQVIVIWANPGAGAETQTLNEQMTVTETVTAGAEATSVGSQVVSEGATATVAAAATHSVMVGGEAGLVYTPAEVQANMGDMVVFTFMSMNHTATQSTFAEPCTAMEGGMDSGFMPNMNNTVDPPPQVAMQVMTTEPLWFYCKQMGHCGKGMTFSINPTADKTQAMFQAMAIQQKGMGAGSAITGNATSSAVAEAPAAATSSAAAEVPAAISSGAGAVQTGACVCAVTCGTGSFPAAVAQGVGAFGGFAGALPASMMETV